jgi:hypothetical protein
VADLHAQRIRVLLVLGQLLAVKFLDPVARQRQRTQRVAVAGFHRRHDLRGGDAHGLGIQLQPVEFLRRLEQGGVAARRDVGHDGARGGIHILRHLALQREKIVETGSEVGSATVEADRH